MTKAKGPAPESFEKSLEALEELVRDLESGDKGLDEALALFEKGITLSKDLSQRLETAKTKVEALAAEGGKLVKRPFTPEQD